MSYEVLARKWRPQQFEDLVGQEHVVRTLRRALSSKREAQAYIFSGPRGVGKTSAARILARALQCKDGPTPEPCGTCPQCKGVLDGSSLDVIEIDAATHRLVEDAEKIRETVRYAPTSSAYKVYIIDEVHMLSNHAFNALLKTLEEPPSFVKFIFATTEYHKIPETITSRCQRLDFRRISVSVISETLGRIAKQEGLEAESGALDLMARAAEGSLRDAEGFLDQAACYSDGPISQSDAEEMLGLASEDLVRQMVRAASASDTTKVLMLIQKAMERGQDPTRLLAQVTEGCRNALFALAAPADEDEKENLELGKALGRNRAIQFLAIMEDGLQRCRRSSMPRVVLELTLLKAALIPELVGLSHAQPGSPSPVASPKPIFAEAQPRTITDIQDAESQDPKSLTLEGIIQRWSLFCNEFRQESAVTAAHLREGRPEALAGNVLRVSFPARSHVDALSRPDDKKMIQEKLEKFFGKVIELEVTVPAEVVLEEETRTQKNKEKKRIVDKKERILEAENDPLVKKAISIFGGRVVDVVDETDGR